MRMKMLRLSPRWLTYFKNITETVALISKDPSTKVGAIIIDIKTKRILSTGFNGFPRGIEDREDRYSDRATKHKYVCHAEANAIVQAACTGVNINKAILFVSLPPCVECAKLIIQAGIREVCFLRDPREETTQPIANDWRESIDFSIAMLEEAGINVYEFNDLKIVDEEITSIK